MEDTETISTTSQIARVLPPNTPFTSSNNFTPSVETRSFFGKCNLCALRGRANKAIDNKIRRICGLWKIVKAGDLDRANLKDPPQRLSDLEEIARIAHELGFGGYNLSNVYLQASKLSLAHNDLHHECAFLKRTQIQYTILYGEDDHRAKYYELRSEDIKKRQRCRHLPTRWKSAAADEPSGISLNRVEDWL